jgi:hypothetical protein
MCKIKKDKINLNKSIDIVDSSDEEDFYEVFLPVVCPEITFDDVEPKTEDKNREDLENNKCSFTECVANVWRWLFRCDKAHEEAQVEQEMMRI